MVASGGSETVIGPCSVRLTQTDHATDVASARGILLGMPSLEEGWLEEERVSAELIRVAAALSENKLGCACELTPTNFPFEAVGIEKVGHHPIRENAGRTLRDIRFASEVGLRVQEHVEQETHHGLGGLSLELGD
eukprot:CAMPEP_0118925332 /NCGR_PEP_ID=MMETSP1169-20130426/3229_1 /TAXON_ID=36882 /ORGANISM="Pyramimonas obovata, Strain CCMP722" /LENGTH=134 /DNA_ID=CAMNT_0006866587 /DNA_START=138 /DNA_END=540 /DNA_ORIENTATION=-